VGGTNAGRWSKIVAFENRIAAGQPSVLRVEPSFPQPIDATSVYVIEPDPQSLPGFLPAYDIYRMRYAPDGKEKETFEKTLNRSTHTSDQDLSSAMRTSGEMMFTTLRILQYRGGKPIYNGGIFRAHPNGSNFHPHNMNRSGYPIVTDNRELPNGIEIRTALDPRNLWGGGALLFSDHQFGFDIEPHNPSDNVSKPYSTSLTYHVPPRGVVRATIPGEGSLNVRHSTFRFLRANMPFFDEVGVQAVTTTGVSPGGFFRDPYPMPDGSVLVSHCPQTVDHLNPNANPDADVYLVKPKVSLQREDEFSVGEMDKIKIPAASFVDTAEVFPRPVMVRLKEAIIHDVFEPEHLGPPKKVKGFTGYPDGTMSFVECYDYYTLDQLLQELAPVSGRFVATPYDWQTGKAVNPAEQVRFVRAVVAMPLTPKDVKPADPNAVRNHDPASTNMSNGIHTLKIIAGEVPLPEDGSFYLNVPPGLPFYAQALNADRMTIRTLDKLFYTTPGEKFRMSVPRALYPQICGGCHGSITGQRSDVLRRPDAVTSASKVSATWDTEKRKKKLPLNHGIVAKLLSGVDFVHDVQPILNKKCATAGCHGGSNPAAGLSLTDKPTRHYNDAYESLMQLEDPASGDYTRKKYVDERNALAIRSYLIEKLYGREMKAPRPLKGESPHPKNNPLTEEEKLTLVRWVDIGAPFKGFVPTAK
jgi:hypothetical protein